MKIEQYKCDVCGAVKGEANHWLWCITGEGDMQIMKWNYLNEGPHAGPKISHVCGSACLQKKLGEFLSR